MILRFIPFLMAEVKHFILNFRFFFLSDLHLILHVACMRNGILELNFSSKIPFCIQLVPLHLSSLFLFSKDTTLFKIIFYKDEG